MLEELLVLELEWLKAMQRYYMAALDFKGGVITQFDRDRYECELDKVNAAIDIVTQKIAKFK
jgi:hypothetical protein|nr:MAG TPA: hypothetical protein [Caudoviricetes sp.]